MPLESPALSAVASDHFLVSSIDFSLSSGPELGNLASTGVDVPPASVAANSVALATMDSSLSSLSDWNEAEVSDLFAEFVRSFPE
jgi:hypothetical protein